MIYVCTCYRRPRSRSPARATTSPWWSPWSRAAAAAVVNQWIPVITDVVITIVVLWTIGPNLRWKQPQLLSLTRRPRIKMQNTILPKPRWQLYLGEFYIVDIFRSRLLYEPACTSSTHSVSQSRSLPFFLPVTSQYIFLKQFYQISNIFDSPSFNFTVFTLNLVFIFQKILMCN